MSNSNEPKTGLRDTVLSVLTQQKVSLCLERKLQGHDASYSTLPWGLHLKIREQIEIERKQLYSHQASALEHILAGRSVCLATPTGSGKSRVFELAAVQAVISSQDQTATVLVVYPRKSLLPDQRDLWNQRLSPYGLEVGLLSRDVPENEREFELARPIVLATAEMMHSWFLANASTTMNWLARLRLVVLDQAHEYDGVLATHMALLLRRLRAISGGHQVLLSCGALREVKRFACELIGAPCEVIDRHEDGSRQDQRLLFGIESTSSPSDHDPGHRAVLVDWTVREQAAFLVALANAGLRFIAYADLQPRMQRVSRKAQLEAADLLIRAVGQAEGIADEEGATILPYRSGRESEDEKRIAGALASRKLRGLLVTSAFDLSVDLEDLDAVVLIDVPPLTKTFWQRIDRVGRTRPGAVIVLGPCQKVAQHIERILASDLECNRFYFSTSTFLLYHAQCAHLESSAFDRWSTAPFEGLPKGFFDFLGHYRNPSASPQSFRLFRELNHQSDEIHWGR